MKNYCNLQNLQAGKLFMFLAKKIPLGMKLFLLTLLCSIGMLQAAGSYAQNARISLHVEEETVADVLVQIEELSDFDFFYNNTHVDLNRRVSVSADNSDIFAILDEVFAGTDVRYTVLDKKIILSTELVKQTSAQQQGNVVRGKVVDVNGNPIIGASVLVKGTTNGMVTDVDGNFVLRNVLPDALLEFSFVGYKKQEINVNQQTVINVTLQEDTEMLDEVVVVGFGTQKKINLTGATASIGEATFKPRALSSVTQYLQGAVANLNIVNNDGGPGQDASINIRGYSGLGTSYAPLIIVDGFPSSLKELNANDIENITVLKDAASAAIYGAQAAYGVILVTTKSGKKNTRPKITYSNNISISSPIAVPKTAGSIEFASLMQEASLNEGGTGIFTQETLERIEQYYYNPGSIPNTIPQASNPNIWANWGDGQCNANEDWFKEMFKSQINQMHNI